MRDAVQSYIAAENWLKARSLAQQSLPDLLPQIEQAYNNDLIKKQDGDELIRRGNVDTALDMYTALRNRDSSSFLTRFRPQSHRSSSSLVRWWGHGDGLCKSGSGDCEAPPKE